MWISSLFQTGMRKLFILGLASSLAACGGGGGGGDKKPSPAPTSATPVSSSSSSLLSSSLSSSISSSSISALNNSSSSSVSSASSINSSSSSSLSNSSSSSISSVIVVPTDTTPDSFSFPAVTGAALSASVTSAVITISGINTAVPISIANGEYSIDGGVFTSVAGTVSNGQTVTLKLISAAVVATETHAVVTIGGIAKSFSVTTANILGGAVQGASLNIAGVVTTIAGAVPGSDGIGSAARFNSPEGTVIDGAYLYVADYGNDKIRKIEMATGAVTTLAGSGISGHADGIGAAASFYRPRGIATDGTYLYVADEANHKIRKIEMATGVVTTLAGSGSAGSDDGVGAAASFTWPRGIATDGSNLYVADSSNNKIRKIGIATGVVTTLAGSGLEGSADGIGSSASFYYPIGITADGDHLYVADGGNNKIRKIVIATGLVTTLAGNGLDDSVDGTAESASFYSPVGIATDGLHLYIVDSNSRKIRKLVIATGVVTTLAGSDEWGSADGIGTAAEFRYPTGITTDGTHLYVADSWNDTIRKIEIATAAVTTLAGNGVYGADGTGAAANLHNPNGIATDGTHLYVADTNSSKIRKIDIATGVVTTLAGSDSDGSADGIGAAASFDEPSGITTDGTHLYVADTWNHKIRKIEIATAVVTTLAGGSWGSTDGTGAAASFRNPQGITTDGTHLYVTDTGNNKIRKIDIATGAVTTLAGGDSSGSVDGSGAAASFNEPRGITTDGTHLYVADCYSNKIRKIDIATGVVTTLAGGDLSGSVDGTGAAASFDEPSGITTDGANLYVSDASNTKIRKIEIATGVVTTLAGSSSSGSADGVGAAAKFYYPEGITTDGFALFVSDNNTIRKIE